MKNEFLLYSEKNNQFYITEDVNKIDLLIANGLKYICEGAINMKIHCSPAEELYITLVNDINMKKADICVIIDGTDDWSSPAFFRGENIAREFEHHIQVGKTEEYHTGVSGIAKSGMKMYLKKKYSISEILTIFEKTIHIMENKDTKLLPVKIDDAPYHWLKTNGKDIRHHGILIHINKDIFLYDFENPITKVN